MPKQPSIKSLRDKADKLLSPLVIKMFPRCLLCKGHTQVAHHFCKKSESNRLRYYLDNLIPLCHPCHFKLHHHETIYSGMIIKEKGIDWFNNLMEEKKKFQKVDRFFYQENIDRLNNLLK